VEEFAKHMNNWTKREHVHMDTTTAQTQDTKSASRYIEDVISLLAEPDQVIELRILNTGSNTVSGYFETRSLLAAAALKWSGRAPGVYITLNRVTPALLARSSNHVTVWAKNTTSDSDIIKRCWLPFDFDPIRPAGISSTDEEHQYSIDIARRAAGFLVESGIPENSIVLSDSGNGAHVLVRVNLPNDAETTNLIQGCIEAAALRFSDDRVSVDLKVFNAARIWKLYGTKACKGDNTTERPHRLAKLLAVPEQGVKIAPREVLRSLASMAPEKRNRDRHTRLHGHFAIDDWISQHGLDIANAGEWHGGRKWIFNTCPWNPEHTNRSAYIVEHPNGAIAAGCHHNGCAGKNWRDLRKVIEGKDESDSFSNSHGNQPLVDHKPSINTGNQDLELLTNQAVAALLHANEPPSFFRHANFAARIEQDDDCNPFVRVMDPDRMRYTLARVARWEKLKDGVAVSVMPPMPVVHDIMATPNLPLPILTHIVEAPVFGPDGTLQVEPGYHKASRTYYAPANGFVMPSVPVRPTAIDIARARDLLTKELLGDFPFTSNTELAHAVGCLILPFVRGLIRGPTPLHLIEKPTAGTGATLLTDVITYIGIGHPAPVMTEAHDEDEWRKRITAKLLTGPSVILIDNIRLWIDSSALSAAITATSWEDRRLGHSEIVRVPVRCAWIATGTNLHLTSELARRTIRIRLDAKVDQPWHRDTKKFLHPNLKAFLALTL